MPSGSQTPQPPSLGMTPASRYIYNLKVLRRRDPSILSIFDQFSHVCVYHHDGQKWDKHGYEGSMFLFERESYPPYGFYIMNRVGMEDYIQPLYPEDDLVHSGKFVIIRSYPDFLNNRLSSIKSAHPGEKLDKFSDVYSIPNIDQIDSKTKGRSSIIGLWMHADDSRDSLIDVMRRLHSYIKQNVSYPEDFHYGPGRPPPPHRLRAIPRKIAGTTSDTGGHHSQSDSENDQSYYSDAPAPSASNGGLNAIDKLFSKLGPSPSVPLFSTSSKTQSSTGISLLNDIFASASTTSSGAQANFAPAVNPTITQTATIFAPQPSIGSSGPQVLNSQVLTTILTGSAPSRAASVSSIVSHPSSREGDNEDDSQSDSPSTILDEDSDYQRSFTDQPATGSSAARLAGADLLSAFGLGVSRAQPKINGDVTPRPPLGTHRAPAPIESTSSIMTIKGSNHVSPPRPMPAPEPTQKPRANRPLVPFESDSELWPYNHKSSNDSSTTDDDNDIVELNFEDTSVLSDPEAFKRVLTQKRSAVSLRGAANGHGAGPHSVNGAASSSDKGKGRNRKKTKKELRDAQEKAEIEKGWDQPTVTVTRGLGMEAVFGNHHASSSPSPSSSPAIGIVTREKPSSSALASEMKTPTMTARMMMPIPSTNGSNVVSGGVAKGKGKLANGHVKANGHSGSGVVDPEVLKDSMLAALDAQSKPIRSTDRNEFMREVAMLIHTDKTFAERLYQDYITRHP